MRALTAFASILLGMASAVPALATPQFTANPLPGENIDAYGVNDYGQVTGLHTGTGKGFVWKGADMAWAPQYFYGFDIGLSGLVTGLYLPPSPQLSQAFVWNGVNAPQPLGNAGACSGNGMSWGTAISDVGVVTGWTTTTSCSETIQAFLNGGSGFVPLGVLGAGYTSSRAQGISDNGTYVVGYSSGTTQPERAFFWRSSTGMQQLATTITDTSGQPVTSTASRAMGVNDLGHSVGWVRNSATNKRVAVRWTSVSSGQSLGILASYLDDCEAIAINDAGQVIGHCYQNGNPTPFYWDAATGMVFLSNITSTPAVGWIVRQAVSINDAGQIVARGINAQGASVSYLLTPNPSARGACIMPNQVCHMVFANQCTGLGGNFHANQVCAFEPPPVEEDM